MGARVILTVLIAASLAIAVSPTPIGAVATTLQESPTPSGTEPSGSPTPTASPTPSERSARAITLVASDTTITAGAAIKLAGEIASTDVECEGQQTVLIRRRTFGTVYFRVFSTVTTTRGGDFELAVRPTRTVEYKATLRRNDQCESATSDIASVFVRVRIVIRASANRVEQGTFVEIFGRVSPRHRRTRVALERRRGTRWVVLDRSRLERRSRYSFTLAVGWEGERTFRVRWPRQDQDHEPNASRPITIRSV